jgi:hypothetical protein
VGKGFGVDDLSGAGSNQAEKGLVNVVLRRGSNAFLAVVPDL